MTVKELIEQLAHMPKNATIYMVTDISDQNYNEDGKIIIVHPIEYVIKEKIVDNDGWEDINETNVLLQIPEK